MFSILLIQALLSSVIWSPVKMTAIFSLTPHQLFTMESLSAIETEDPKQASTVLPDQNPETNETYPLTDGGSRASSQIVVTSPAASFSNGADGVENKNRPEPMATSMGSKQQMAHTYPGIQGTENSSSCSMPFSGANKSIAFADHFAFAFSNTPKGNSTDTERHRFCKIPGTKEQKRVQGEKGSTGNFIT